MSTIPKVASHMFKFKQVFKLCLWCGCGKVYFIQRLSIHEMVFNIYISYGVKWKTQRKQQKKKEKGNIPQMMHCGHPESVDQVQHQICAHRQGPPVAA